MKGPRRKAQQPGPPVPQPAPARPLKPRPWLALLLGILLFLWIVALLVLYFTTRSAR